MNSDKILLNLSVLVTCYNKIDSVDVCFGALREMALLGAKVIIIDDGSTDGSSDLLVALKTEQDVNIQIVRTLNQGAGPARLLSIELATTEFCFFLDIDDLPIISGVIELLNVLESSTADLAVGNYKVVQNNEAGLMPVSVNDFKQVSLKEFQQQFKDSMGWWRYIYKRDFLTQQHNMVGKAFEEFGNKRFVLDDLFWMICFG